VRKKREKEEVREEKKPRTTTLLPSRRTRYSTKVYPHKSRRSLEKGKKRKEKDTAGPRRYLPPYGSSSSAPGVALANKWRKKEGEEGEKKKKKKNNN